MVALADLLAAQPGVWRDQGSAWVGLGRDLDDHAAQLRRHAVALREAWRTGGVDGGLRRSEQVATLWQQRAARVRDIGRILTTHADRIDTARRRADAVVRAAGPTHAVRPDGTIAINPVLLAQPDPGLRRDLDRRSHDLAGELDQILTDAQRVDDDSARALRAAGTDLPVLDWPRVTAVSIPPSTSSPTEVARWWGGLDTAQREYLFSADPTRIGALDGVPVLDRDRANRIGLDAAAEQLRNRRDSALRLSPGPDRDHALAAVEEEARALGAIRARLTTGEPAYLLGLDTTGTGRAIVAVGDPDTADNVVTFVPGAGARLATAPADVVRAEAVLDSARRADPAATTSVITWIGYRAPQQIIGLPLGEDATNPTYARDAGAVLDRFQDGLRATHQGEPSHNTVLGHSYGSTVIGYAARDHHLDADDLVFVGSPGVGTDTALELGHDPNHVWSGHTGNDPIRYGISPEELQIGIGLPDPSPGGTGLVHGLDPGGTGFGAEVFGTQDGSLGPDAHDEYWLPGSESLLNLGRIAAGRYDQVTR